MPIVIGIIAALCLGALLFGLLFSIRKARKESMKQVEESVQKFTSMNQRVPANATSMNKQRVPANVTSTNKQKVSTNVWNKERQDTILTAERKRKEQEKKARFEEAFKKLLEEQAFVDVNECVKQEIMSAGHADCCGDIEKLFDFIYSHKTTKVSPTGTDYWWWEYPGEYIGCAFESIIIEWDYFVRKTGVEFLASEDVAVTSEQIDFLKRLSELYNAPVRIFRSDNLGDYKEIITGERYVLKSTYKGYSHDGSEDYYDTELIKA